MTYLATFVAPLILVGVPILMVWGMVRQREELNALRARARARGYEAESASSFYGKSGDFEWTATTFVERTGDGWDSGLQETEGPSYWSFGARWLPVKEILENAMNQLVSVRLGNTPTLTTDCLRIALVPPASDDASMWSRFDDPAVHWVGKEAASTLTEETRTAFVAWMKSQVTTEAQLRRTPYTFDIAVKHSPNEPTEDEFARFIDLSLRICKEWARSP